jgi:hypothetical protein
MKPTRKRLSESAVSRLSQQAQRAAAEAPDPLAGLSAAIKTALASETDPYVMLGVLLEGATQTLLQHIPVERRLGTLSAALVMFSERLAAKGAAPQSRDPCEREHTRN